jgi:hypothetical protein
MGPLHAAFDRRDRLAGAFAGGASLGILAADGVDAEIAKLTIEEAVVGAAAEFPVGREFEADTLLQRNRLLDGRILGRGERIGANLAASELAPLFEQRLRTQQAADVLGAERRLQLRQQWFLLMLVFQA